jgi:hypothetical protein
MNQLPVELAEPLHILPGWISTGLWLVLAAVLVFLAYLFLWPKFMKWLDTPEPENQQVNLYPQSKEDAIVQKIDELVEYYSEYKKYRDGLFALSEIMRNYITNRTGLSITEKTASEMHGLFAGKHPHLFFKDLEKRMFSQKSVTLTSLKDSCTNAKKTVRKKLRALK